MAELQEHLREKHGVTVFSRTLQNYLLRIARR